MFRNIHIRVVERGFAHGHMLWRWLLASRRWRPLGGSAPWGRWSLEQVSVSGVSGVWCCGHSCVSLGVFCRLLIPRGDLVGRLLILSISISNHNDRIEFRVNALGLSLHAISFDHTSQSQTSATGFSRPPSSMIEVRSPSSREIVTKNWHDRHIGWLEFTELNFPGQLSNNKSQRVKIS